MKMKKRKFLTLTTINFMVTGLIIIAFACSLFVSPVLAQGNPVKILSSNGFIDILDQYSIYGELQNAGSQPLKFVEINVTFYDAQGSILGSAFTFAELHVLHPNERSPFWLWFADTVLSAKVDHYSFTTDYSTAQALPQQLRILSSNMDLTQDHISGEIQNLGDETTSFAEVIATLYDANGKVVDLGFDYAMNQEYSWQPLYGKLVSGSRATFNIAFSTSVPVSSYRLTAQSIEYSLLDILPSPTPTATPTPTPTPANTVAPTQVPTASPPYSSQNPTPTPTVPEFPELVITLALVFTIGSATMLALKRKLTAIGLSF